MEYSKEVLVAVVRAHPAVMNELEARDVVFRRDLDSVERRRVAPWGMLGREALRQEEFELWLALQASDVTESDAVERMTDLMERYYGRDYPLRK